MHGFGDSLWRIDLTYLLALLPWAMKVRRQYALCYLLEAFLGCLLDAADGRQPIDVATARLLDSISGILANLLHE